MNAKLLLVLTRCYTTICREIEPSLKEEGLTLSQFYALEALLNFKELSIKQLTKKSFSTSGTMTVVLSNLEKKGYVKRVENQLDKRENFICLSRIGEEKIIQVLSYLGTKLSDEFDVLSKTEKIITIELLKKLGKGSQNNTTS